MADELAQNWAAWWLASILVALLAAMMVAAYLQVRRKNHKATQQIREQLEAEVFAQTEALRKANDWLLNEVVQRQRIQDQLQTSQAALNEREQHLRSLLDNIPDPIWFKNLSGVYVSCNRAFAQMLGKTEAEVIGNSEEELVSQELAEAFRFNDQLALNNPELHRYEQRLQLQRGRDYLLDISKVAVRDEQGAAIGILGIGRDIAAQKQAERDLSIAKDVAEQATRAKSRFLANMSHEIRTPLNAVLGYTQLLMRDDELKPHQRERLELILSSSQRLLGLINDVLDLSKIESGTLNLRQEHFDLYQEVVDIHTIMQERAAAKGLQLIIQIDLPEPYVVQGDRQKIGQILLNLLGNAIKFTPRGSVSLHVVPLTHNNVEFVIGDTGPGIAEKELNELFAAFRQGQAGDEMGGTGLGLALSRHLAEGMGGSLQLSSVLGQGTLAYLVLPLVQESVALEQPERARQVLRLQPGCECQVLVVEDDPASADILVNLLREIGCETLAARDGREGLLQCTNRRFDIIFTDIRMPSVNGVQMLRKLRAQPGSLQTPVVAVSASSLEHERAFYLAQGFQDFIGKPYAFEDIFAALRKFTQCRFIEADAPASIDLPASPDMIELAPVKPRLIELARLASEGDMAKCKKLANQLTPEQLGGQRHQQLLAALRQYDLERVEQLVANWLKQ